MMLNKLNINHIRGLFAEYIVMFRYLLRLYIPIKHRYKSKLGEIDLILRKGNTIVFCEVKARSSNFALNNFELKDMITQTQQNRLKSSATNFLLKNKHMNIQNARFDFALVRSIFDVTIYENWTL